MTIKKRLPKQDYDRKGRAYQPHEVLDFLPNPADHPKGFKLKKVKREYDGDMIKMGSDRYFTFAKGLKCAFCDLTGTVMYKERGLTKKGEPFCDSFHFNLYAIDEEGEEVLMTKDHIIPRSRGGKDVVSNYQTCCAHCNSEKGSTQNDKFIAQKELSA